MNSARWTLGVLAAALAEVAPAAGLEAQSGALRTLEAGIVAELNRARTDPAGYASFLEAMLPEFDGTLRRTPNGLLQSREGPAAVREAIAALRSTAPMGPLEHSAGVSAAARDLALDQSRTGDLGHQGSDGSNPETRISRYGRWGGALSENVSYSAFTTVTARDVVIQLLVDDGVPSRGHRSNILDPTMRVVGVACEPHARYAVVCVMNHVREYSER